MAFVVGLYTKIADNEIHYNKLVVSNNKLRKYVSMTSIFSSPWALTTIFLNIFLVLKMPQNRTIFVHGENYVVSVFQTITR